MCVCLWVCVCDIFTLLHIQDTCVYRLVYANERVKMIVLYIYIYIYTSSLGREDVMKKILRLVIKYFGKVQVDTFNLNKHVDNVRSKMRSTWPYFFAGEHLVYTLQTLIIRKDHIVHFGFLFALVSVFNGLSPSLGYSVPKQLLLNSRSPI